MNPALMFRAALVGLAVLVSALVLTAESRSSGSAGAGDLVYGRSGELYVRTAGGAVSRLTRNRVFDGLPAWSPDRSRIVFVRSSGHDADIWVMNADGSAARRLAGSAYGAHDLYPRFSPDGRLIVFQSTRGDREPDLYVMRADGTGVRKLVGGPRYVQDTQPSFSPDGRYVIFASNRPGFFNFEIYRVRASDGGGLTRLTFWGSGEDGAPGDDLSPSYSPDGRRIVFVSDRKGGYAVWTMSPSGRGLREVVRHRGMNVVFPRFSPDGRAILYTAFRDGGGPERLWAVSSSGGTPRALGLGTAADW